MAELRHSSSMGSRVTSSPMKRGDEDTTPFMPEDQSVDSSKDRDRDNRTFWHQFNFLCPYLFTDNEARVSPNNYNYSKIISLAVLSFFILAGFVSILWIWNRYNAPYLCKKDGIVLRCPSVKEAPSLWENPYSSTISWKPCAERRHGEFSNLLPENETTGYVFIHAEGGLNQQRIAICNAVAVAKIMNATLILPVLKQDQIWKDQTKLEDIFDVDHFIDYLKDDVRIVHDIPEWFTDKSELFTSIKLVCGFGRLNCTF